MKKFRLVSSPIASPALAHLTLVWVPTVINLTTWIEKKKKQVHTVKDVQF